jgi:hypothetical protein
MERRIVKLTILMMAASALAAQSLKFDLVPGKPAPGFQKVAPGAPYSEEKGYGFENAATEPPFYFSIRVPEEGNYSVTVTLGACRR